MKGLALTHANFLQELSEALIGCRGSGWRLTLISNVSVSRYGRRVTLHPESNTTSYSFLRSLEVLRRRFGASWGLPLEIASIGRLNSRAARLVVHTFSTSVNSFLSRDSCNSRMKMQHCYSAIAHESPSFTVAKSLYLVYVVLSCSCQEYIALSGTGCVLANVVQIAAECIWYSVHTMYECATRVSLIRHRLS